jgi:BirA family biotin operon repressor/biotin-[acetyl-CoA-carboxylase] ligase
VRFEVHEHERVDSTQERAFEALASGTARDGDVHVAREQTAGRGRLGRAWHGAPGAGLYASVVLLPPPPPIDAAALTVAAGLAAHDALLDLGLARARLKWPNDVVAGAAKLAGLIVETRGFDPGRPHYVLGIGLNVAQRSFPPELGRAATSLALEGVHASVAQALDAFLARLPARLEEARGDQAALERDYLRACGLSLRSRVRVLAGEETLEGELAALSLRSGLALRTAAGERRLELAHVRGLAAR